MMYNYYGQEPLKAYIFYTTFNYFKAKLLTDFRKQIYILFKHKMANILQPQN